MTLPPLPVALLYAGPTIGVLLFGLMGFRRCREIYWLSRPWRRPPDDLLYTRDPEMDWVEYRRLHLLPPGFCWWVGGGTLVFWLVIAAGVSADETWFAMGIGGLLFYGLAVPIGFGPVRWSSTDAAMLPLLAGWPAILFGGSVAMIVHETAGAGDGLVMLLVSSGTVAWMYAAWRFWPAIKAMSGAAPPPPSSLR